VNDLEEVIIQDLPEIKRTVFISCWTGIEKESIPLWALYASRTRGVRIKLPPSMFKNGTEPYRLIDTSCNIINLQSLENIIERKDHVFQWIPYIIGPVPVDYKDDTSVSILEDNELKVHRIGTVKLKHWTFEEEQRFIIIPDALWNQLTKKFELNKEFLKYPIAIEYIDIPLDESKLDNIEITIGPGSKEPEKTIVDSLLRQYTKNGIAKDSELKDRIKLR